MAPIRRRSPIVSADLRSIATSLQEHREESALWRGETKTQLDNLALSVKNVQSEVGQLQSTVAVLDGERDRRNALDLARVAAGGNGKPPSKSQRGARWWITLLAVIVGAIGAMKGAILFAVDVADAFVRAAQLPPPH